MSDVGDDWREHLKGLETKLCESFELRGVYPCEEVHAYIYATRELFRQQEERHTEAMRLRGEREANAIRAAMHSAIRESNARVLAELAALDVDDGEGVEGDDA